MAPSNSAGRTEELRAGRPSVGWERAAHRAVTLCRPRGQGLCTASVIAGSFLPRRGFKGGHRDHQSDHNSRALEPALREGQRTPPGTQAAVPRGLRAAQAGGSRGGMQSPALEGVRARGTPSSPHSHLSPAPPEALPPPPPDAPRRARRPAPRPLPSFPRPREPPTWASTRALQPAEVGRRGAGEPLPLAAAEAGRELRHPIG